MKRKMTVVFHDEELYRSLKIEAAKLDTPASAIISQALKDWFRDQDNGREKIKRGAV